MGGITWKGLSQKKEGRPGEMRGAVPMGGGVQVFQRGREEKNQIGFEGGEAVGFGSEVIVGDHGMTEGLCHGPCFSGLQMNGSRQV